MLLKANEIERRSSSEIGGERDGDGGELTRGCNSIQTGDDITPARVNWHCGKR